MFRECSHQFGEFPEIIGVMGVGKSASLHSRTITQSQVTRELAPLPMNYSVLVHFTHLGKSVGFLLHYEGRERPGFCMITSFPMPEGIGYS
jgi:hypothetical protein